MNLRFHTHGCRTRSIRGFLFFLSLSFTAHSALAQTPTITSFSPASGPVGATVIITGTNFNTTASNDLVYVGGVRAVVNSASSTSLSLAVPSGATYAPITVTDTTTGLTAYSKLPFIVTFPGSRGVNNSSFLKEIDLTTGAGPRKIAIADIDNDGKPDIVVANASDGTISVLLNTSTTGSLTDGSFAPKVDLTVGGYPSEVAFGDLDGDGRVDIVVGNSNSVSVFQNFSVPHNVAFGLPVTLSTLAEGGKVAIGDIDGDGRPDIAVAYWSGWNSPVSILRNTCTKGLLSTASFAPEVDFTVSPYFNTVAIADVDGDGKPDLVITNNYSNTVSVLRDTGTVGNIQFAGKVDFATGSFPVAVTVGDIDGDGKPDLVIVNSGSNTVSVLRNIAVSGSITPGSFASKIDFPTGVGPNDVAIGDVNGDGKPDLVVANSNGNTVSVLRNTATSGSITSNSFAPKIDFTIGGNPYGVAVGDLDGDGRPDIVVSNNNRDTLSLLRNVSSVPAPTLLFPSDGATNQPVNPILLWHAVIGAKSYHVQLARDSNFVSGIVLNDTTVTDTSRLVNGLANGTYWWRVNAKDSTNAVGPWSNVWHFGTGAVGYWPVTFQVNMKIQMLRGAFLPGSGGVVCVAGDFNGWGGTGYTDTLKDPNQDSIFTKTISLADTSFIHYKYVTSPTTGGHWESNQPTASGMREFRVPVGGGAIPVVYFNNDSTIVTPNSPVLLAPVNGATNQPVNPILLWHAVIGAKSYHVQLARDSNFVSGIVLNDTTVTDTSRLVNGLANGTYYWWRVNAKDSANAVGPWSNVWHFGTGAVGYWPVTFQVNMKIQMLRGVFLPGSGGVVCVAGDFNGWGGVGYTDTLKDPNQDSIFTKTISLADTSFIHYKYVTSPTTGGHWENDQPTASGMREFRVPVGGGAIPVVYFNNDSTITTPNAPVLIAPVNGATNQPTTLTLRWNQSAGAAKYYLQVCSASDFSALVFDDSTLIDTSYHIGPTSYNTLAYNTTYYWRVGAGNSAGWSAFSTRFSFMTFPQVAITPPVVSFPSDPTASTSYRLFSFPGVTTTTIGSIISGTQQTDWRMFRDNGAASNYLVELSSDDYIGPGEGYWLLKKGNLSLAQVTIEMPPIAADRTYGIPLHSGWNIISNPFDRAVLWSDIIGQNGLDSATKAWTYVGNFVDTVTVLAPFRGYYFSNDTNLTSLGIPYPFWQNIAPVQPPRADWQVQIIFESDINKDPANYIGIVSSSKSGLLKYHSHKPRLMFDQGFLCFNRSEWDAKNSRFNADYRSSLGDGQAWDFEVSNPRKSGAKITFKNIEQIPAGNEVILVNQLNTTPFDVRLKNEYVYATVSERMPFKLIVGKKQFVENEIAKLLPDKFELMQNFPNPFNPTTSISFKVAREAQVRLAVYSVLGERIKILTDGLHSPAVYTVTWDGTSESGNRIASGMYLCRLVVNGKSIQTKKLLLVK